MLAQQNQAEQNREENEAAAAEARAEAEDQAFMDAFEANAGEEIDYDDPLNSAFIQDDSAALPHLIEQQNEAPEKQKEKQIVPEVAEKDKQVVQEIQADIDSILFGESNVIQDDLNTGAN